MTSELNSLLRETSRSFYLTLRVLPSAIRHQIGLAYLLARTSDTIADTEVLPVKERLSALEEFRARALGENSQRLNFNALLAHQGSDAERSLLKRINKPLEILDDTSPIDKRLIREVLRTIIRGQELDLERFQSASTSEIVALTTATELDDYTYRVAGCVGEFWTNMCLSHLFFEAGMENNALVACGIRFGKGLQLVNILRDLAADLRVGRCYLPKDELALAGLAPSDLLNPLSESQLRPVYDRYLELAESHLKAGWEYTNALPWGKVRVRLACAWPIMIGLETLEKLRELPVLNPEQKVKVSRAAVKRIMMRSVMLYPFPTGWQQLAHFHTA